MKSAVFRAFYKRKEQGMKTLIVYYSWHNGNTKRIAQMIQKKTGADLCAIETVTPYPKEYRAASDQGKRETETGFKPEIKRLPYDIVSTS